MDRYRMGVLEGEQREERFDFIFSLIIINLPAFQNKGLIYIKPLFIHIYKIPKHHRQRLI